MNILNVEKVSKAFGEKVLLDNVTLGINKGDKIGIIGVNGTGKSTLLKIIAGIEEPDEGNIIKVILEKKYSKIDMMEDYIC